MPIMEPKYRERTGEIFVMRHSDNRLNIPARARAKDGLPAGMPADRT